MRAPAERRRPIAIGVAVAVAYVLAARLGFALAVVAEQITTVWAPTGIAQAALLLWGRRLWPAVWVGAFAANAGADSPLWASAGIATGNTLEAIVAASILRPARFDPGLRRLRDVLAFIVVAAGFSTALGATVGVSTLCTAGVQPWSRFAELWSAWWLGDAIGALVIAPVILTLARTSSSWSSRDAVETGLLIASTVAATHLVFGTVLGRASGHHPFEYVVFPFVILAAVRLGQPAVALVVLAAAAVTIANTVRGAGPFATTDVHQGLVLLQTFLSMVGGTALLLAAAIAERRTGDSRRGAAYAAGDVLATAADLNQAAPAILQAICDKLEWQVGALWLVDHDARHLQCASVWSADAATGAFVAATRGATFAPGLGLPGRVWATGRSAWIEDVLVDRNFPRAAAARAGGLHGAFAFPICLGSEVLGVVECFNRSVLTPDPDLLHTMATVGNQIGQFVARKREESAVREAERRTRAILDTALDAIIGMDDRGRITAFNPAAEHTFGYDKDEAIGRELADLLIPRQLRERHRAGLARYLSTGEGPFIDTRVETTGYHARGHEFPVEVSITQVPGEEPPRFTGFVRDLTARAEAERERERLLARESAARLEAEAANRAKDEFLATLSHELRTPLNAIVGWTQMLLGGTLDQHGTRRALQVIERNAHLQAQLISDILDVSRIITGGLRLNIRPVDLGSVIGAALDAVRPAAEAKQITVSTRLDAAARLTEGDPQRLQQIIWNLLANAVKFTPAGGRVEVELTASGDNIRIQVRDNGVGIDPEFLPHVFERFRQADGSASREHGGLGLGLAIVRHLVEVHGGTVRAESAGARQGSTFTVDLPAAGSGEAFRPVRDTPAGDGSATLRADVLAGCRALVVEDEEDSRELLAAILAAAGASVRTASCAADALRQLDQQRPDVLLADIGMPGMDGFDLIREIRAREMQTGDRLPAAAITAYTADSDRQRALAAGFDRHVSKPVTPAAVVEAVHALCFKR